MKSHRKMEESRMTRHTGTLRLAAGLLAVAAMAGGVGMGGAAVAAAAAGAEKSTEAGGAA